MVWKEHQSAWPKRRIAEEAKEIRLRLGVTFYIHFLSCFLIFLSLCHTLNKTRLNCFVYSMRIFNYDNLRCLSGRFPGLASCCHELSRCCPDLLRLLLSPDLGLKTWPSLFPIPAASYGNLPSGPLPDAGCQSWHLRYAIAASRRSSSWTVEALHCHWWTLLL